MELGQIVFSKCGRDRAGAFVVVGLFTESGKQYAWLADGRRRKVCTPKKKKLMHIQTTKAVVSDMERKLTGDTQALNAEIREALKAYNEPVL